MPAPSLTRREVLQSLVGLGVGTVVFQRALAAEVADQGEVSAEMIRQAEWIAGLELSDDDRAATADAVESALDGFRRLREVDLTNDVAPAIHFNPQPSAFGVPGPVSASFSTGTELQRPPADEDLAFLSVGELATLVRSRQVSSTELTQLYLARLRKYDPLLHCVVTLTEDLAIRQARQADEEIAAGRYRGPLHGIPWGAKDLLAYPGYPTTWGAPQYREQEINTKAAVAERLERAGAVLVAKLTSGALAMGDQWFGGQTRNPWDPEQGSSGSSAGSASATAAGLVGFSIGTETLGSIVSPCRRCGCSGLRPTFGRVSRYGCMTLTWSMDKIGPICRTIEDCAVVLGAICGSDGRDPTAVDRPFQWPCPRPLEELRVGYIEDKRSVEERPELVTLRGLGVQLVPIQLPQEYPVRDLTVILNTEAACVFDRHIRENDIEGLGRWPNAWRQGQFVPAVEYLRANRIRTLLMEQMNETFQQVDLYVGGNDLPLANLTGHPTTVIRDGYRDRGEKRVPISTTFTGKLFGESELVAVTHAYQVARGLHLERPPLDLPKPEASP